MPEMLSVSCLDERDRPDVSRFSHPLRSGSGSGSDSGGLSGACSSLSVCARYLPSSGYTWNFDADEDEVDPVALMKLHKRTKRRKVLDNRKAGERNEAEEEGLRSSQAIDQILVRLSKSPLVSSSAMTSRSTIAVAEPPSSTTSSVVAGPNVDRK